MLTEKQKINPFYIMDNIEFKKLAIRYVGGKIINYPREIFGYNDEFNTFIIAKKSYNLGSRNYYNARSYLSDKKNTEHVLVIALSFNGGFKKKVKEDLEKSVIPVTVDELLKEDYASILPQIIEEINNPTPPGPTPPGPLSKFFTIKCH